MVPGRRVGTLTVLLLVVAVACSPHSVSIDDVPPLTEIGPEEVSALLAGSDRPVVLHIWASWCVPCRSEAPLLREGAATFGDEVRFIGIAVKDGQNDARSFLAEFGLTDFEHYLDPDQSVPADLAGFGVPQTYFFAPGGELMYRHVGAIDERTLALRVDDLRRWGG